MENEQQNNLEHFKEHEDFSFAQYITALAESKDNKNLFDKFFVNENIATMLCTMSAKEATFLVLNEIKKRVRNKEELSDMTLPSLAELASKMSVTFKNIGKTQESVTQFNQMNINFKEEEADEILRRLVPPAANSDIISEAQPVEE